MEILGYIASLLIGLALGLFGGGGSILAIPVLVYLFEIEPVRASAYSLFIVGSASLLGTLAKQRDGLVDFRTGILFGIPSVATIFCTRKWFVPLLPDTLATLDGFTLTKRLLILGVFVVFMIASAMSMLRKNQPARLSATNIPLHLMILQGCAIGFVTGLVGVGGGFLIIPALIVLTNLPYKTAAGTSLLIIAMNSLIGFAGDVTNYSMDWTFLLTITGFALVGLLVGNSISKKVAAQSLKRALGWLILAISIFILAREIPQAL